MMLGTPKTLYVIAMATIMTDIVYASNSLEPMDLVVAAQLAVPILEVAVENMVAVKAITVGQGGPASAFLCQACHLPAHGKI